MFATEVETIEEGLNAARRAAKRGVEELHDMKDEATHRVKRHPIESVGTALGVGLVIGAVVGWTAHRLCR